MLFVFILAPLILPVCGSTTDPGSPVTETKCQWPNFCITLREGVITAEAGLCVVIPCSFTTDPAFKTTNIVWYKCDSPNIGCSYSNMIFNSKYPRLITNRGFKGRVSLLEPDVSERNCSIIINDLGKSDSGFYQLRVEGTMSARKTGRTFTVKTALILNDLTQKPSVIIPPLTEGQQTTLSCTAPGLCSGSAPEITWTWREGGGAAGNIQTQNLSAIKQRHDSTLTFTPSAEHHGTNITCQVSFKNSISTEKTETLIVSYLKDPVIRGEETVKLGDALNLTCSVDCFPPSVVTWTKLSYNKTLIKDTKTAILIIPDMTAEDAGKYVCSASHQITSLTARTEVNVTVKPRILNSSVCEVQSEVLTCVCISQGFPLPTIEWPLLKKQTHYCLTTSMTNTAVNTSISLSAKDHNYTTVDCMSKNEFGEVKKELKVIIKNVTKSELKNKDLIQKLYKQPEVIIAFLIGLLLSAVICCSVQKCHRKKQKSSGITSTENLEMMDVDPSLVNGGSYGQDRAEGGAGAGVEPREVEYSNINFDLLKRGRPIGAESSLKTTEYAEIKKAKTESNDGGMMEGNHEEERNDYMIETEEEQLYSNVEDLMKEV